MFLRGQFRFSSPISSSSVVDQVSLFGALQLVLVALHVWVVFCVLRVLFFSSVLYCLGRIVRSAQMLLLDFSWLGLSFPFSLVACMCGFCRSEPDTPMFGYKVRIALKR